MIYFKRTPSGLRTATAICAPASSPRISARCSCVRGAYAPPSRSAEGLGDFSDLLAEADPAGAAGAACSALGRLGAGRLRARVPVPVRVQAATLRKASGHGVAKASLFIRSLHTCPLLVELGDRRGLVLHGCNRSVHDAAAAARVECGCVPEPVKLRPSAPGPEGARWSCAAA